MLNDGQQQPVDNFTPKKSQSKTFFKDGAISSGDSEVKEAASVEKKHMLEYISKLYLR
jgi:hypothetical protein